MANVTITVDSNHDDLTSRAAGENITINSGAKLTIDSIIHLTPRGIMGLITCNDGEIHIDGTRTFEVAYSGGSGTLVAVGDVITWNGGADSGKVIQLNSGNNVAGVLTLTKDVGDTTPDDADVITDGAWSADIDSVKVGYLIFYGEDQDWVAPDAKATLRITGDWYVAGVGTGADSQSITLPHAGHQHCVWVETGNGTDVYEKWHRISSAASTVFYDSFAEFGTHYESGKVFQQTFGSSTLTFGTSTGGGNPPNGARIRIPNVHLGTTTVGTPTTEVNSTTIGAHFKPIADNTTENVFLDHVNFSSVQLSLIQTNGATISDSCFGLAVANFLQRNNSPVTMNNVAFVQPSVNTTGGLAASVAYTITDNLGGITLTDTLWYGGVDSTTAGALYLTTMANITFEGITKVALSITDENTSYTIRSTQSSNVVFNGELILLGGGIIASAGSNDWYFEYLKFGYPPNRGTTEQNQNCLALTGCDTWQMDAFNLVNGGKFPTLGLFLLTDCANIILRNAGTISSKIDGGNRLTYIVSFAGITQNVKMQRLWFTNINGQEEVFLGVNSVTNILIENCSANYNSEIEADINNTIIRGVHAASGALDSTSGWEGDNNNVVGTVFHDYFTSNTAGALGLLFNAPGNVHAADVEITAGTPIWNGLGDLLMRTSGDQVIYTWPYLIKGHTAFQNAALTAAGVNHLTNHTYEYSIRPIGGDWSAWATANGANLSAETIDPAGFSFRLRITCSSTSTTNAIKNLAILTDTTLTDQNDNLYPLEVVPVIITVLDVNTNLPVENARVFLETSPGAVEIFNDLTNSSGIVQNLEYGYTSNTSVVGRVRKGSSAPYYKTSPISGTITSNGFEVTVFLIPDE